MLWPDRVGQVADLRGLMAGSVAFVDFFMMLLICICECIHIRYR